MAAQNVDESLQNVSLWHRNLMEVDGWFPFCTKRRQKKVSQEHEKLMKVDEKSPGHTYS